MEQLLQQKTLMISSMTKEGKPFISYAPFVKVEEKFYIYISETAEHYENLCHNKEIAVMLIEDEQTAKTIFARCRVSFNCTASLLEAEDEKIWEAFEQVQGSELLQVLKTLDFHMFELTPHTGRLVKGFGKAYNLTLKEGKWEQDQATGMGHGQGKPMGHPGRM
ncbi:MAG: pyridoxamine 5'-phosphate oxidase family protein [Niameybacter sp.]|uniref:HugZ family pyridoxamine 5'-phosphate oxidase n=1 Tax=Niameybacter sp. TaxID=2033640 RepID=UPI002FC5D008